ncbi:MAG: hypothetical protein JO313_08165 [Verrucomicrobia bacterium]|nr:hypothetical protein [Verrucomicrobiota bacterium]
MRPLSHLGIFHPFIFVVFFSNFMCGHCRRTTSEEELARLYHIPIPTKSDLPISYNVAPSQKVLTIRFNPESRAQSLDVLPETIRLLTGPF